MSAGSRDLDTLLARLGTLHPRIIDLSFARIEQLLAVLGRPERQLPPVVHVAGTNGKGSTIAFCRAALEAAGVVEGLFAGVLALVERCGADPDQLAELGGVGLVHQRDVGVLLVNLVLVEADALEQVDGHRHPPH